MENWYKLWEYTGNGSKQWIPGDTVYISNYGNVKLNDELLSLGHGLYMTEQGDIHIVGLSYGKYKTIYRFIYTMAVEPEFNGGHQWQLHHYDRNHSNNRYDNIVKLTCKEHTMEHAYDQFNNELLKRLDELKQYYKEQSDKRFEHIAATKEWLHNRYIKYYNDIVVPRKEAERKQKEEQKKEQRKLREEQRKQQKLIEEQKLIDAGTHFRCKDGRLMSYQQIQNMHAGPRDTSYITPEFRQKMREKQLENAELGINTGKAKSKEKEEERKRKIREKLKGNRNATGPRKKKYIVIG